MTESYQGFADRNALVVLHSEQFDELGRRQQSLFHAEIAKGHIALVLLGVNARDISRHEQTFCDRQVAEGRVAALHEAQGFTNMSGIDFASSDQELSEELNGHYCVGA